MIVVDDEISILWSLIIIVCLVALRANIAEKTLAHVKVSVIVRDIKEAGLLTNIINSELNLVSRF